MENLKKAKAVKDDSGHWYVIPAELEQYFNKDLEDEEMVDSGYFDVKYGEYRTGGDLNNVQLYAKFEDE